MNLPAIDPALLATVLDLQELLQRHAPGGPLRHRLYHDQLPQSAAWPAALEQRAPLLEELLRGACCLIANGFVAAVPPLLRELLPRLRELDEALTGGLAPVVREFYEQLTRKLELPGVVDPLQACCFCGEALALYLDLLCVARPALHAELGQEVLRLRRELNVWRSAAELTS